MSEPPLLCGKPLQTDPPNHPNPPPNNFKNLLIAQSASEPNPPTSKPPIPPSFPKKRRGRPPGSSNTTKESDYASNPSVQLWNAHRAPNPIPAMAINIRLALPASALTQPTQRAVYQLPSREIIHFVQGSITPRHIASNRPSYVNGLLIHSRGEDSPVSCAQCVEKRDKAGLGPFLVCRVLKGVFHDCCSNCKWYDGASGCSLYTGPKPNRKRKKDGGGGGGGEGAPDVEGSASGLDGIDPTLPSEFSLAELMTVDSTGRLSIGDATS